MDGHLHGKVKKEQGAPGPMEKGKSMCFE